MVEKSEVKVADAAVTDEGAGTKDEGIETPETIEETHETIMEETPEEREHRERSALGRKVAAIERNVNEKFDTLNSNIERLMSLQMKPGDEFDEDEVVTAKSLTEILDRRENQIKQAQDKYNGNYHKTLVNLGVDEDEDIHNGIIKELEANFNFARTNDGERDATANYTKASRAYFKKQLNLQKKTVPVKGKGNDLPLGSGADGEKIVEKDNSFSLPKLDAAALDYIKKRGLSEEQVQKFLKADLPLSMSGLNINGPGK